MKVLNVERYSNVNEEKCCVPTIKAIEYCQKKLRSEIYDLVPIVVHKHINSKIQIEYEKASALSMQSIHLIIFSTTRNSIFRKTKHPLHTIWQGTQPCLEPASIYQHTDVNGNVTFDWHSASCRCHKASPPRGPMAAHERWSGNDLVLTPRVTLRIFWKYYFFTFFLYKYFQKIRISRSNL